MKVVTAQVVDGRIEVPPEISDGSQVAILAPDDGKPFGLSPADEQELSEALADIHAGRYVDGWALLDELKAQTEARQLPAEVQGLGDSDRSRGDH